MIDLGSLNLILAFLIGKWLSTFVQIARVHISSDKDTTNNISILNSTIA